MRGSSAEREDGGLVLISPYTSVIELAKHHGLPSMATWLLAECCYNGSIQVAVDHVLLKGHLCGVERAPTLWCIHGASSATRLTVLG